MLIVRETSTFSSWFARLGDIRAQGRIALRIRRVALGNLGDVKSVGGGVAELRVDYGPGYRVYFARRGEAVIILLCGGNKGSQNRDVERAKEIAAGL